MTCVDFSDSPDPIKIIGATSRSQHKRFVIRMSDFIEFFSVFQRLSGYKNYAFKLSYILQHALWHFIAGAIGI